MFRLIKILYQKKRFTRIMSNMIFAILFFAVLYFIGGKFATNFLDEKENISFYDAVYFSIVTQSTVGYGDLVPTNVLTKSITMIQLLSIVAIICAEFD